MDDDKEDVDQIEKEKVEAIVYEYKQQLSSKRQLSAVLLLFAGFETLLFAGYVAGVDSIVAMIDALAIVVAPPFEMIAVAATVTADAVGATLVPLATISVLAGIYILTTYAGDLSR